MNASDQATLVVFFSDAIQTVQASTAAVLLLC
jgi:hypothetical protein